jgi:hypothetical protein
MNKPNKILVVAAISICMTIAIPQAMALPSFLDNFNTTYPAAVGSRIDICNLCHTAGGGTPLNPYGLDFNTSNKNFTAIENLDSDGDGYTNIAEIQNLTFPGNASDHPAVTQPISTAVETTVPVETAIGTSTETPTETPANTPKSPGFEIVSVIIALSALYIIGKRR